MTTIAERNGSVGSDRTFFMAMAGAIAATVVIGFGVSLARPTTQFAAAPAYVHIHGAIFALWIAFYLAQNLLIARRAVGLHRAMGLFGAVLAVVLVATGIYTTLQAQALHRVPFFFAPGVFLVLDVTTMLAFAGLTFAGLLLRRDPAWHKRLMLCGTIVVMSPALGRLLPMPLLGLWNTWAVSGTMLLYVVAGMAYDRATLGRAHPAYLWGAGAVVFNQLLIATLSFTAPVLALAARLQS